MQPTSRPSFEFDRRSALWGAGAYVLLAGTVLALGGDWTAFLLAGVVAGLVVTGRSGFYDQTANTGLVAGIAGFACFTPVLFAQQFVAFQVDGMATGDSALYAAIFLSGHAIALAPASGLFSYVTAAMLDMILRKTGIITSPKSGSTR